MKVSLKNEYIEIYFNGNRDLLMSFDEFDNFDDIKEFLFNYCCKKGIIKLRPLEERKWGSIHR